MIPKKIWNEDGNTIRDFCMQQLLLPSYLKTYSKFVLTKCYFKAVLMITGVLRGMSRIYSKEREPQVCLRDGGSPCFH